MRYITKQPNEINQLYVNRTAGNMETSTRKLPVPCVARLSAGPVKTQKRLNHNTVWNTLDINQYNDNK